MSIGKSEPLEYERAMQALLQRSTGKYKAFLYDCDGTLADNMQAHKDTYVKIAAGSGVVLDPAIVDEFAGLPIPAVVEQINARYGSNFDPIEFERLKSELFYEEFIEQTKPVQFVVDHLIAHAGKIKIGVVSGGSRKMIEKTLQVLRVDSLVEVLVCAGETLNGKPYPDPFLLAAEKLGVSPEACLVFEDGDPGVKAAEAAGMKWVRVDKIAEKTLLD
ncbi:MULTISPECIES: HAD family hydrolase [Pontibacter]|uniref:Haloacid dehalogenase superfamily, subfamily IA, variant 3 with third motif having DD or ED/haloacid dehalogenase superfamily, subfamily IA, variant 1 with third motif having Dx(3-4)D or Dx(3-4)E n=2 Tax=Pontibacter TaxID=323449 RepID=A0A239JEF7_9BACT|nr:HAD-IA family hydrolase [Pontibacter ummariensis]PRY08370.1 HAD superfamily hydrolase (TIGR01509 family)/HAD superfamily hydrolase (TIGR01549 family) [Pontibacter ummariensis]SNT03818.1 haloacid dehalogenase superfamily, subfamily IA, variant 3 with third motif having DD or ED/haloacid dehalogenase superfamily, subfamily IA, variant 1 with third motif having Dx(3-4)D or Dx(3-4)E [Pontibacter ummariensis]